MDRLTIRYDLGIVERRGMQTYFSNNHLTIHPDGASPGLHRAGKAHRRVEASPSEAVVGHVRQTILNPNFASLTDTPKSSQYTNEAYDYPPNIRESFNDLGRTITDKVQLLSHATSPAEVQTAFTAPPSAKPQPKTFSHAIARASLAGSQLLNQTHAGASEDPLATALEKYALASEKVGEARLAQDSQIQSRFLAGWSTTLNTNLMFATRARRGVENSRLSLDATKQKGKTGAGRSMNPDEEMITMSEEVRADVEQKEDDFVGQTEEAVGVMKNVRQPGFARVDLRKSRITNLVLWDRSSILPSPSATSPI